MSKVVDKYGSYIAIMTIVSFVVGMLILAFSSIHNNNVQDDACTKSGGMWVMSKCWYGCDLNKPDGK